MSIKYQTLSRCLCCDSENLEEILDLKTQPLANNYHKNNSELCEYPLALNVCRNCYHCQLSVSVNPDEMFRHYLYVSGTSSTLKKYFEYFADIVVDRYLTKTKKDEEINILDIACNDGSQLEAFANKNKGYRLYGVDPAINLSEISKTKGFNLVVDYWNRNTSRSLPIMDIIIAQNVFAHNSDPKDFLDNCYTSMDDDSVLLIQTSQADMFTNNEFDTIYHEHISFFCINSMNTLAKRTGLSLIDVFKTDIHGNSYVFVLKKDRQQHKYDEHIQSLINQENKTVQELYTWKNNVVKIVNNLADTIYEFRKNKYTIVGYGAAAKGNTLLNFGQIKLDYIVDDNKLKQGLFTPGMNIPIKSTEYLRTNERVLIIPLAWNFFKEIKKKTIDIRGPMKETRFLLYFPEIKVE